MVSNHGREHSSVFMMAVEHHENTEAASVLRTVAPSLSPVSAAGVEYCYDREFGPGGEPLAEIAAQRDPQDPARVRQLQRYSTR